MLVSADGPSAKGLGCSGWPAANEDAGIFLNPMVRGVDVETLARSLLRFKKNLAGSKSSLAEKHQRVSRMDEEELRLNWLTIGARGKLGVADMKPRHSWEDEQQQKKGGG